MYPVSGGFYIYSSRFIDPSWGFAMGWNYVAQWATVLPLELTICAVCIEYWNDELSPGIFIAIFLVAIILINIFGGIGYAEEEFWSSCLKLGATVAFMFISLVLVCGGGPSNGRYNEYWGTRYWREDPGAFKNGFKGFCSVFVTAAFSFAGTELVGLAAAESENPTKALPGAIKQVFWRITLFFVLGLFFIGLLIKSTDDRLNISGYSNAKASPFVLVGEYSGLTGLAHFMNVIILVSVLSLGVSCVYGGSRTLTAMAQNGYAPKMFAYIDRGGRPLVSVAVHILMGFIAFVNLDPKGGEIFDWLLALSGLSTLFTWGSICLAHIRFRKAWARQGHTLDEIPFRAAFGVVGSWISLGLICLVLIAQVSHRISRSNNHDANKDNSSMLLLLLLLVNLVWELSRDSSSHTSLCLLSLSSGLLVTCGSARVGSQSTRSMLTLVDVSTTGTRSTPTVPRLPLGPLGDASSTRSCKAVVLF
ncbi:hypothetical protein FOCG_14599 [Fusarium oxysporum f. sp. radicis-lycopersici 26381]|uniref:Amino acid permease/ SLC12A domain-containing protein n=5 Tax=Fusarium oxysporum species complex TaxID=171631 RepID=W9I112_FUSOX|nr:uncharacterized protein FOIG_07668 [Fusarium odoratissimum NRRL 54006]EWY86181.1 hypothetical protein FOYG_10804 [Fusarium oxysporum NRRL 32931]EWZ31794.1 hypothetical protein FOZG_14879 [Fusarium oxysporum Fo47]EWZ94383.1 hypothetical protein FOWG_04705 [Fusarium oxysporum f. sp. lycopersici MN25]EXL43075.1 hypothetical protein FOCG_14599 [Fusarium oxysporum f. sp. radicis-lycopersici 26381]EXM00721.1 hypothetical protein FOIG_07668 [Fusarium odoratissimum NRRL 54006]